MKRFALVGLSILCLSLAATTAVKAGTRTERIAMSTVTPTATIVSEPASPKTTPLAETRTEHLAMSTATLDSNPANTKLTPFGLVALAYQGAYRMQGVPGFGSFKTGIASKTITAQDLVKAAIDAHQLAPDAQTDSDYLNAIELQLSSTRQ